MLTDHGRCFVFYGVAVISATSALAAVFQLESEKTVLTDQDVLGHRELQFGGDLTGSGATTVQNQNISCKLLPGDAAWPDEAQWALLNDSIGGNLVEPSPIAKPCYLNDTQDVSLCAQISDNWEDSMLHINHSSSIMQPLYGGISCPPTEGPTGIAPTLPCTLGGYPVYVVNAQNARDVQAAVNFARNMNIRLVIKNTGHDFLGKSSGVGSLSIRTHFFNEIEFLGDNFTVNNYSGPAFKVGVGVLGKDIYAATHAAGYAVVGGEGETVGWGGGFLQGGGHSPLGSVHGMGADQVLRYEVVLANGRLVTTDAELNPDLFWALRGGGGSTFGVAISVTAKAFPNSPVTISKFTFNTTQRDLDNYAKNVTDRHDFWEVFRSYMALFPTHADRGIYSYFKMYPTYESASFTFTMSSLVAPNISAQEVNTLLQPMVDKATELSVPLTLNTTEYDSFYPAWQNGFTKESMGTWVAQSGSRLWPRKNWATPESFNSTFDVIKNFVNNNSYMVGVNIAPTLEVAGNPDNSVNPAWRDTVFHCITGVTWDDTLRNMTEIDEIRLDFTNRMNVWRDASPGSGAYLGEADINEPNRQQSFWGGNYGRLYQLKQKYDPTGVFFAETAVGSEDWETGAHRLGRLCPASG